MCVRNPALRTLQIFFCHILLILFGRRNEIISVETENSRQSIFFRCHWNNIYEHTSAYLWMRENCFRYPEHLFSYHNFCYNIWMFCSRKFNYAFERRKVDFYFVFDSSNWLMENQELTFSTFFFVHFIVASTEDSPIANKLKRIWFKTPIGEEQATQAVLDPVVGK